MLQCVYVFQCFVCLSVCTPVSVCLSLHIPGSTCFSDCVPMSACRILSEFQCLCALGTISHCLYVLVFPCP